jgi:hypothetical protein
MAKKEKSLMRQLIEERGIKDIAGVQALVKELTAGLIQEAMDAELEEDSVTANTTTKTSRLKTAGMAAIKRPSAAARVISN